MRKLLYFAVVLFITALDQISKYLAQARLVLNSKVWIIDNFFALFLTHNDGVAFSMLEGKQLLLKFITVVAIGIFVYLIVDADKKKNWFEVGCILMMFGGCIGNFIDRIQYSYVIDYFSFRFFGWDFAVFNVADCFITVGAILYIIVLFKEMKNAKD